MEDRNIPSQPSSSSSTAVKDTCLRRRRHVVEEDGGDSATCTCQSCTAGVIADCVAVCCCPCAVVNILALIFLKLPYAVARRCIARRKRKGRRRKEEKKKCCSTVAEEEVASENVAPPTCQDVIGEGDLSENFGTEFKAEEEVWLELYNVGHLGFGRVSFTGSPPHGKGN